MKGGILILYHQYIIVINTKKSITFKVLVGYLLVTAFSVFAVWIVFEQIVNITRTNNINDTNNQKLFLISEAVTNLYVAEGISRNIIQNEKASLLPKFNAELDTIVVLIDSLKEFYEDKSIKTELDSITYLLSLKESNLKELLAIREQGATESYYARVMEKLELGENQPDNRIYKGNIRELDPSVRELILRMKEYKKTQNWNQKKSDSLINSMKKVLTNLDTEERKYQSALDKKENELLENDRQLSIQLRNIRSEIEQEEIQKSVAQVAESQEMLKKTSTLIAIIGAGSVLTILLFVVLIIRDTNKSQKYRQELERSKSFTESLLKGREQMMATVTHDLRSPLNSISGYSDLLKKTPLNEKQAHYLGHLKKSSNYILRLVNDLLDLSKLEVGKMTVEHLPFNPKTLIEETLERSIPVQDEKNIEIVTDFSENLDQQISSDPFRIQQILTNLISNAYKFTDQGKIVVKAVLTGVGKRKTFLKISIKDSGIGISKEQQKIIFEEFSQAESSIEKKYGGFGLGLAITKKLTELLNGSMKLDSNLGEGSNFSISIPVKSLGKKDISAEETTVTSEEYRFENTLGKKILVIDDEPSQLALTSEVLRQSGLVFDASNNPLAAYKLLKTKSYDLILTDIQMPKMNGFQLIRKLKSSKKTSNIPVIALSGRTDVDKTLYLEKGFKGNLIKPYNANELLALIGKTLGIEMTILKKQQENKTFDIEAAYDLSDLKDFVQNDEKVLKEILQAFITGNRENIEALQGFSINNDVEGISKTAHKMLPMFKQLKIKEAIAPLKELENAQIHHLGKAHVSLLTKTIIEKTRTILEELQEKLENQ